MLEKFEGHREKEGRESNAGVGGLDFRPDGSLFASASNDGLVRLWQFPSGELELELSAFALGNGSGGYVESVEFSDDGRFLASGGADGILRIWDVENGIPHCEIPVHPDPESPSKRGSHLWNLKWFPNSWKIATAAADGTVSIVDLDESVWERAMQKFMPREQ